MHPPPGLRWPTGRPSRPSWTGCGSGRRRTPARVTRSRRPGGGCRWWRWTPPSPLIGPDGRSRCCEVFEGRRQLIAYYFMWHAGHPAAAPVRGLHVLQRPGRASCPTCIRATSPTPPSARARTTRASATATSWAGTCPGTRRRTRSDTLLAGRQIGLMLPRVLPAGRRPRLRDLLDDPARRRGDGLQLRADGPHRLRTPGAVGGLARWLAECTNTRCGRPPGWPPVPQSNGRPIAQWPRLAAGHSDDLGTART